MLLQPYDLEVGAGTSHTATFLRAIGPEPWNAAYVQPSRRPKDGRYGENPNRLQHYYQFQVVLKPSPLNIQELYLAATQALNAGCDMVLVCNQSLKDGHELDAALDGMSDALAKGLWLPNEASEERRFSLMPTSSHLDWDSLMVSAPYMAALELLP